MTAMSTPSIAFSLRLRLAMFLEQPRIQRLIFVAIILNALLLGLDTFIHIDGTQLQTLLMVDRGFIALFVVEIALRVYAQGWRFFRNPWNSFDFIVVAISIVPTSDATSILRVIRVMRVMRLISIIPSMRMVVDSLFKAIPGISSTFVILGIFFYAYAVMGTQLYRHISPENFGTFSTSIYSLYLMMMHSWPTDIIDPVVEKTPASWFYFVTFTVVVKFAILNVIVGVIVGTMQSAAKAKNEAMLANMRDENEARQKYMMQALQRIEASVLDNKKAIKKSSAVKATTTKKKKS